MYEQTNIAPPPFAMNIQTSVKIVTNRYLQKCDQAAKFERKLLFMFYQYYRVVFS